MFNSPFLAICRSQCSLLKSLTSKSKNCAANNLEKRKNGQLSYERAL